MKKWMVRQNKVNTEKMAQATGVSPVVAQVLANRGIGTSNAVEMFINPQEKFMHNGYLFKDMDKGIAAISQAIDKGQKISVYGDYDVDGVSSSVILYKTLSAFTDNVMYYVPHRQKEGYGINVESVEELKNLGVNLILTCDNGITAVNEAKVIEELGMSLVIIDHHEPAFQVLEDGTRVDIIPVAKAVIDHKQKDCPYPFKALCAGGMAYKFSQLLFEKRGAKFHLQEELLVFAAIATICDIVDLLDENRIIAKKGIGLIKKCQNPGLKALIKETGLDVDSISEYHLGFVIGPCINATGRLESAKDAIELFTTQDEKRCGELASALVALNSERKLLTAKATKECIDLVENSNFGEDKILVVYNPNIHESIAGIVAGRIKEKYYKPTIVITASEEMAKGSARSIEGYNMFEALYANKELFNKFGGHPMAAGLSLREENIDKLRENLNKSCVLKEEELLPVIKIEQSLKIEDIDLNLAKALENLAPFGKENPMPIFGSKKFFAEKLSLIGKDKSIIKYSFRDKKTGKRLDGIDFSGLEEFRRICENKYGIKQTEDILNGLEGIEIDVLYTVGVNTYMGRSSVQLLIKDFRMEG